MRGVLRGAGLALIAGIACGAASWARDAAPHRAISEASQASEAGGSETRPYGMLEEGGAQQFAELGDLKLQSVGAIHEFRLGYRTLGKLNAEKSNAVLWPTWLGGDTETLLQFVGPGKVLDSGKYFVVLVDSIGNGVTTSPSNSASQRWGKFPEFTIRDMVEAERRFVTEKLGLTHLRAVMGVSMGGKIGRAHV